MPVDIFVDVVGAAAAAAVILFYLSFYLGAQFVSFYFVRHFTVALFLRLRVYTFFYFSVACYSFVFRSLNFSEFFFFLFICLVHRKI